MALVLSLALAAFAPPASSLHGPAVAHRCRRALPLMQDDKSATLQDDKSATPYAKLASVPAAGDAAALLVFAAIGRGNHNSDGGNIFTTAAPFLATWALLSPLLGAYKPADTRAAFLLAPLPTIAVAVPLGCALRGLLQGYQPPLPFWIVALIATTVLVEGWRFVFYTLDDTFDQFTAAILDDDD